MDWLTELRDRVTKARDCGVVHLEVRARNEPGEPADPRAEADDLVRSLGLRAIGESWRELTRDEARAALRDVLHRDQAYRGELMSESAAQAFADEFLVGFGPGARFYTNAVFPSEAERGLPGWAGSYDPITSATFDTGVLVVSAREAGLLWIEDED